ncbi:MAG: carboxypeptidase regulatory-like domain-containing protein [Calditrichaeota bacterium]|nr:carboxypeptidase regulatory-like domain-containing protein [Calditrichota bacterium]
MKGIKILTIVALGFVLGFSAMPAFADAAVNGVVLDADGAAVAGAQVTIQGMMMGRNMRPFVARAETDGEGRFGFRAVPSGNYIIMAMHRVAGGARAELRVADADLNVELRLQGHMGGGGGGGGGGGDVVTGDIAITVLDAEGNAVEGARVIVMPVRLHRRGMIRAHFHGETDANGQISFENIPVGNYVVTAGLRGVGIGRARAEVIQDETEEVEITLQAGRR